MVWVYIILHGYSSRDTQKTCTIMRLHKYNFFKVLEMLFILFSFNCLVISFNFLCRGLGRGGEKKKGKDGGREERRRKDSPANEMIS